MRRPGRSEPLDPLSLRDPRLAARWERARAALARTKPSLARWRIVRDVIDAKPPLYLAGGFRTAKAFLAKHAGVERRTARRMMTLARHATDADLARWSAPKLEAAISFLAARGALPSGRVRFAALRVPTRRGEVPLGDAGVGEVRAAAREALPLPPGIRRLRAAMTGELEGVRIVLGRGRVSFLAVPIEALPALARAIAPRRQHTHSLETTPAPSRPTREPARRGGL
jgi:hypothetical protein